MKIFARENGVVVPSIIELPTFTFPFESTEKSEAPDDEATLNRLILDVDVACTLNTYEDDVALIPVTVPLSMKVDVPSVVASKKRDT